MGAGPEGGVSGVLIAIPALNEAEIVGSVVREVAEYLPAPATVLVVDDGSVDATARVAAAAGAVVVQMPFNIGVGGAMRAAFLYASRAGYERVVQVDADGQHDPRYLKSLLDLLDRNDIVIGARFAGVGFYRTRGPRKLAMRILSSVLSWITGTRLTDVTSGFRASGPRAIALFARDYPSEYLGDTVESLVLAHRAGLRVGQVGVEMRPRQAGSPSQNPIKATIYLARAVLVLGLSLVRSRPALDPGDPPSDSTR
jgi:glycosyltransferase involved in cell wall biosynthesis